MQIFIERLRELRTEKGMSQKELARLLNTTNSSVCDWERGRSEPNLETVAQIARQLHVPQGTVKSRLSRAREKLRTMLGEEESP